MNLTLAALYEDIRMIGQFGTRGSEQRAARHKARTQDIISVAQPGV
jgi:hypothetical protein